MAIVTHKGMLMTEQAAAQVFRIEREIYLDRLAKRESEGWFIVRDGSEVVITRKTPIVRAFIALHNGLRFGYPLCCVEEFCVDLLEGRHPGIRRGSVPVGEDRGVYVPCSECCDAMGRTRP